MNEEGPLLEHLVRRLAECPREFLGRPVIKGKGEVNVLAVVSDLVADLGGEPIRGSVALRLGGSAIDSLAEVNRLQLVLVTSWLLHDEWFRGKKNAARFALEFMDKELDKLASLVGASLFVTDAERREELVRHALSGLGYRPAGETELQARDRLTALSSIERQRVLEESRFAQERAEAVRKAIAEQAAREAAAKSSRE